MLCALTCECCQSQGSELDGHKLLLQLSQRKRLPDDDAKAGKAAKGGKANATKLVRQATQGSGFPGFCWVSGRWDQCRHSSCRPESCIL